MTYRDPNSPTPRRGEGSRGDTSGRAQPHGDDPIASPRPPSRRAPASGRRPADLGVPSREALPRSRSAVPPSATGDPFTAPVGASRRRPVDPSAGGGRAARESQGQPGADDPSDPAAWSDLVDDWNAERDDWEELPAAEPARRPAPARRRSRDTARARVRSRPSINLPSARLPGFMPQSDLLGDQLSLALIGVNVLSLIVMLILLGAQLGQLPPSFPVHLDAAGLPDRWGTPPVLWRLPLIAGMTLLMNLVIAWFVSPIDRFAARFAVAAALGVQLLIWIAVFDFV